MPNNQILCFWNHSKGNKRFQFTIRNRKTRWWNSAGIEWAMQMECFFWCIYKLDKSCEHIHPCSLSHACTQSTTPHMHARTHSHTHTLTHTHTQVCAQSFLMSSSCWQMEIGVHKKMSDWCVTLAMMQVMSSGFPPETQHKLVGECGNRSSWCNYNRQHTRQKGSLILFKFIWTMCSRYTFMSAGGNVA